MKTFLYVGDFTNFLHQHKNSYDIFYGLTSPKKISNEVYFSEN